jgi:hypothetical protein
VASLRNRPRRTLAALIRLSPARPREVYFATATPKIDAAPGRISAWVRTKSRRFGPAGLRPAELTPSGRSDPRIPLEELSVLDDQP